MFLLDNKMPQKLVSKTKIHFKPGWHYETTMEAPCAGIYSFALVSGLPLSSKLSRAALDAARTAKLQNLNWEQMHQQDTALTFLSPALSDLPGMCFPMYLMCISCSPTSVGAYLTVTVPSLLSTMSGVSVFPEGMCTSPTKSHRGSYRKRSCLLPFSHPQRIV